MNESIVARVTKAVADAEGVTPAELEFVLSDYVDCGALRQLANSETNSWTLSFELPDHTVTVRSDETVLVDGQKSKPVFTARM